MRRITTWRYWRGRHLVSRRALHRLRHPTHLLLPTRRRGRDWSWWPVRMRMDPLTTRERRIRPLRPRPFSPLALALLERGSRSRTRKCARSGGRCRGGRRRGSSGLCGLALLRGIARRAEHSFRDDEVAKEMNGVDRCKVSLGGFREVGICSNFRGDDSRVEASRMRGVEIK